jgi:hypothetical protein
MPVTSKGQTTVPKEVRDALDVGVTTERPALWRWAGSVKGGPDDPVQAVAEARKRRGRI